MIIFRYFAKEICGVLFATTIILLLIFVSNQFIHYMHSAVRGHITAKFVLLLLFLKLPVLLAIVLPLSLFLGILLGFGRIYADNEMVVLFASGVARVKLYKVAIIIATFMAVVISVLVLWVGPQLNKYADKLIAKGAFSPLELIQAGKFQNFNQWVFYVGRISRKHNKLYDIFAVKQPGSQSLLFAQSGMQEMNKIGDTFLVFHDGKQYLRDKSKQDYQAISFKDYGILLEQQQAVDKYDADAISTLALWQDYSNPKAAAGLQWRLSMPIMAIILALIAVPLSRVNTRHGRYAQLVPAMLLYIIYGNFMFLTRIWLQSGKISVALGMWWIHALMAFVAIVLFGYQMGFLNIGRIVSK